ncbi:MAG: glycosyltransferase family 2 protein [Candidatus Methanoperedens sp.]|nr:glycosyltransferase family 2 protein [Candidatus Methanoperedens sp.]MCE8428757.1 glycosyltransferase family 2 protein [Candidatus Methanoperedens sp.]
MTESKISPLVSIGMPVYNGGKTIRQALDSLLAQDFENFELIISDNASTDSTGNICQQYAACDPRVRYYRNETNIGELANFNRLVYLARGKYFMWAADDDLWEPSYVSHMVNALDNNLDVVLSFCSFDTLCAIRKKIFIFQDNWSKIIRGSRFYRLFHSSYLLPWGTYRSCYIYGLIRKDILLKCGGMEPRVDIHAGADILTLLHLLYYGKFIKVNKLLYHRRYNSERLLLKEPFAQRLARQSLFSLVVSYLKWLSMWHQHYKIRRVIVKETPLQMPHKIILLISLCIAELFFYFDNLLRTTMYTIRDYQRYIGQPNHMN